eukprot:6178631-Pleurochrysis_carterae.AAC.1
MEKRAYLEYPEAVHAQCGVKGRDKYVADHCLKQHFLVGAYLQGPIWRENLSMPGNLLLKLKFAKLTRSSKVEGCCVPARQPAV